MAGPPRRRPVAINGRSRTAAAAMAPVASLLAALALLAGVVVFVLRAPMNPGPADERVALEGTVLPAATMPGSDTMVKVATPPVLADTAEIAALPTVAPPRPETRPAVTAPAVASLPRVGPSPTPRVMAFATEVPSARPTPTPRSEAPTATASGSAPTPAGGTGEGQAPVAMAADAAVPLVAPVDPTPIPEPERVTAPAPPRVPVPGPGPAAVAAPSSVVPAEDRPSPTAQAETVQERVRAELAEREAARQRAPARPARSKPRVPVAEESGEAVVVIPTPVMVSSAPVVHAPSVGDVPILPGQDAPMAAPRVPDGNALREEITERVTDPRP